MLSPDVFFVAEQLAAAYSSILNVDRFAYSAMNTRIGVLSPDPGWLERIRGEMKLIAGSGAAWQTQKPKVLAPIVAAFDDYASAIAGVATQSSEFTKSEHWRQALGRLCETLAACAATVEESQALFKTLVVDLQSGEKVLSDSLNLAWSELAAEEARMVDLATKIGALQTHIDNLEASLSAGEISSGQSIVQSEVSISYTLVSAGGASIPYLAIVGLLITIGKGAYDIFVTDKEINESIAKIGQARLDASLEAQAAAMTKAVIQMINGFDKTLAAIQNRLPPIAEMFRTERSKVQAAIDALQAGADPDNVLDLVTISAAATGWQELDRFARKLLRAPERGRSVALSTDPAGGHLQAR
jgi:hypothetical protein